MANRWEAIPSRCWRNKKGASASIYGALPYTSQKQKFEERWEIVDIGWTVRDNWSGTVGIGRTPWENQEDAQEFCDRHNN